MIDTVVIKIPYGQYSILDPTRLSSPKQRGKYLLRAFNPTKQEQLRFGYLPRLTEYERFSHGSGKFLKAEFSAPKIIYGNNFCELVESNKDEVIGQVYKKLRAIGFAVTEYHLRNADIFSIHYSKNILLENNLSCSLVINELSKIDLTKRLDLTKTNYRNGGQSLYFASKSHQLTFYNKVRDLLNAKISDSRAIGSDNFIQMNLLSGNQALLNKEIVRVEARPSRRKLKSLQSTISLPEELTFDSLFTLSAYQAVMYDYYWQSIKSSCTPFTTRSDRPLQLLQLLLASGISPNEVLKILAYHFVSEACGSRQFCEAMSGYYSNESVRRIIRSAKRRLPINDVRYEIIQQLDKALKHYVPFTKDSLNIIVIWLRAPPNRLDSYISYRRIEIIRHYEQDKNNHISPCIHGRTTRSWQLSR